MKDIEKLPEGTIRCLDGQDFMQIINKLMQQKEDLLSEISMKIVEIDTWVQVLQVTSVKEINELVETLPVTSEFDMEETKLLQDYAKLSKEINAYSQLSNCHAYLIEEGDLLLKFTSSPPDSSVNSLLIWLSVTSDNAYSVKHHDLPDTIPVAKLEQKYLKNDLGTEALKKFTTAVYQFTWPLIQRQRQIDLLEGSDVFLGVKHVYKNKGLTLLTFTLKAVENEKTSYTEFILKYDPKDILPYEVKTGVVGKGKQSQEVKDSIETLALEMQAKPFYEVLHSTFTSQESYEKRTQHSDTDSHSTASSSSGLFEMF